MQRRFFGGWLYDGMVVCPGILEAVCQVVDGTWSAGGTGAADEDTASGGGDAGEEEDELLHGGGLLKGS